MKTSQTILLGFLLFASSFASQPAEIALNTRQQIQDGPSWKVVEGETAIDPKKTAIIICDMWDKHWCRSATARVGEMAPRMNELLKAARAKGILIIHAPSDTMDFYKEFPQRKKAGALPRAEAPAGIGQWKSLNQQKEGPLPIDDSDGGCDDLPQCANYKAWKKQIEALEIKDDDYISDRGDEVYNILQAHGIDNVIILGVHTNMCVLGRPFSIRQMVSLKKNTFLVRDMTDTMYNPRKAPQVSHFAGTDLVIGHIEKHWCPTITSVDFLGGKPFRFKADPRKTAALIVGENEYETWDTLPAFAASVLRTNEINYTLVHASTHVADYNFKNARALSDADLIILSTRRRALPKDMMSAVREHLQAGRPLVGIRTASHAFALRDKAKEQLDRSRYAEWPEFDPEVLGGNYTGHHSKVTSPLTVSLAPESAVHPILKDIPIAELRTSGSLYKVSPLKKDAKPLLIGHLENQPSEPLAWTHLYGPSKARIFYTSLGHPQDFKNEAFRKMLLNAIQWTLAEPSK